jgi:hypothetical protein
VKKEVDRLLQDRFIQPCRYADWVSNIVSVEKKKMDRLSRKTESESGRTESELGKTESSSGKEKPVLGNTNQLPGNVDRLLGKADLETEPSSGKAEPGPSYRCGLQEELETILGEEDNEESVTKKSESGNVGSPIDEEKMELMKGYDLVEGGDTIRTDWTLPLLKCIKDPGKLRTRGSSGKC